MITQNDYFGPYANHPEIDESMHTRAATLLFTVNELLADAVHSGVIMRTNPRTGTLVSGQLNGGWRPANCPIGAPDSSHKQAMGVDVYDPTDSIEAWITDAELELRGLYREAPKATPSWVHLTTRPPKSGNRTFIP